MGTSCFDRSYLDFDEVEEEEEVKYVDLIRLHKRKEKQYSAR